MRFIIRTVYLPWTNSGAMAKVATPTSATVLHLALAEAALFRGQRAKVSLYHEHRMGLWRKALADPITPIWAPLLSDPLQLSLYRWS